MVAREYRVSSFYAGLTPILARGNFTKVILPALR